MKSLYTVKDEMVNHILGENFAYHISEREFTFIILKGSQDYIWVSQYTLVPRDIINNG